jgi:hypothetical protein
MTNVPGPQTPLYLGGAEIKQVMFWVPQSGDIGMGVSILSYNGMVQFGLITDAQMVPDPEAIIGHFRPQFDQLVYYVLMSSWGEADLEASKQAALHAETETPKVPSRRSRPASKPRAKGARTKSAPDVKSEAPPEPDTEAPVAEAPKSRPVSKRRAKSAQPRLDTQANPPAAPEPKAEISVAKARKSRPPSQPRTRGTQTKPGPQAQPQAAPEPQSTARRKLPRK